MKFKLIKSSSFKQIITLTDYRNYYHNTEMKHPLVYTTSTKSYDGATALSNYTEWSTTNTVSTSAYIAS